MAEHIKRRFSIGLRTGRHKLGITQQQIAEIAEFSPNAIAMIERGERVPNLETAARLCWALDIASGATAEEIGA
jgi:DNA-binding XRE family transcriptional regulator